MKLLLLGVLVVLSWVSPARAQTTQSASGWRGTVGVGPVLLPKYVGGKALEALPLPIAYVDYDDRFYINLFRAGAYLWGSQDKKRAISFAVEPRMGFKSNSGPRLAGMQTRRSSLQGGPTFDWEGDFGALSVGYFTDLGGASDGGYLDALLIKPLLKNERWTVNGTAQISRLNAKIVNYYFGVRPSEITPARPLYQPGAATNVTLWVTGQYNLSKHYALMLGANLTQLGGSAADSPLLERRQAPLVYIGLGWDL
ncbi:MAG: MipA/OmpV family protein [Betaproteobacteria bacterium]|nr:MipA/OmpV family protein [Betaproteobacteria bacterium]